MANFEGGGQTGLVESRRLHHFIRTLGEYKSRCGYTGSYQAQIAAVLLHLDLGVSGKPDV